jgi:hypothetical protein
LNNDYLCSSSVLSNAEGSKRSPVTYENRMSGRTMCDRQFQSGRVCIN